MRSRIIAFVVLIAIGMTSTLATNQRSSEDQKAAKSYIVQAGSVDQAKTIIARAGGQVTHVLEIINAVGAQLTDKQLASVRAQKGLGRVYEDRVVTASAIAPAACSLSADERLTFKGDDRIVWMVKNENAGTLSIERMMVMWPRRSGSLRNIEFDKRNVFAGAVRGTTASFDAADLLARPDDDNDSDDDSDRRPIPDGLTLDGGASLEIKVRFDRTVADKDSYEIRLFFKEGCSIDLPLAAQYAYPGDSDRGAKRTYVASLTGADSLHWSGITGAGVGVAVVDTGIWTNQKQSRYLLANARGYGRVVAQYDAIAGKTTLRTFHSDKSGHGSHVTSLILSSRRKDSEFNGIAPGAHAVAVKAFDTDGKGTYLDVIRGLDWVLKHKDVYRIRVLNLSFSAAPRSRYWDDPLNQAVMKAWQNGIVVVASAGNYGPAPMTIGVPGNLPYVITVGAMTDSVTPLDWSDDKLASFSSAGPTYEGFVKPDLVAPGGHVRGLMGKDSRFAARHPHYYDGDAYFTMSGTSQSTAIVTGAVALLLQTQPWLVPDQVKCKLQSSARTARESDGTRAYSVFQQGAGLVDIPAALTSPEHSCANVGLDVTADLAGSMHFRGPASRNASGEYVVDNPSGNRWNGSFDFSQGYAWGGGMAWNDGMPWNDIAVWGDGMPWNDIKLRGDGMPWNDIARSSVSIGTWVKQE